MHDDDYRPAFWYRGRHLQTLWGPLLRRGRRPPLRRERLETSDDDFVDLDWLGGGAAAAPPPPFPHGPPGPRPGAPPPAPLRAGPPARGGPARPPGRGAPLPVVQRRGEPARPPVPLGGYPRP